MGTEHHAGPPDQRVRAAPEAPRPVPGGPRPSARLGRAEEATECPAAGLRVVLVGGFLGAGKTTTMLAAARLLEGRGERVAIITNDQGSDLVDTRLVRREVPAGEVTGGCFCCRFDDLAAAIVQLRDETDPTLVLAEAVGSCADLQATVIRPLRVLYGDELTVAPLTVLVDPLRYRLFGLPLADTDLGYLYHHQLGEADVIAINKTDLLAEDEPPRLRAEFGERFPHATLITTSATTGAGIEKLVACWWRDGSDTAAYPIDYERYGAAESRLAWSNRTFLVRGAGLQPARWVARMLDHFARAAAESATAIGHVKVLAETPYGLTKASLTGVSTPTFDHRQEAPAAEVAVTVNARVQTNPEHLDTLLDDAVQAANRACRGVTKGRSDKAFRPKFPVPVHRMGGSDESSMLP